MTIPYHPCMHEEAHHTVARIHLPVAPNCNTHCGYCERQILPEDNLTVGPGLTASVMSPSEALVKTGEFLKRWGLDSVVGIAGPGEPLANEETFETLRLIRRDYPNLTLCVCTNGIELPDRCNELRGLGVQHLTVTINGLDPIVVSRIQPVVTKLGQTFTGVEAAKLLIDSQMKGLKMASDIGMFVKVNSVVIPEINGTHVSAIARAVKALGAQVFNPIPVLPRGRFKDVSKPDQQYMAKIRSECGHVLPVFHNCKQCRADAEGIPGKEIGGCARKLEKFPVAAF